MSKQEQASELPPDQLARLLAIGAEEMPGVSVHQTTGGGPFLTGETVDGFRIEEEIGRGGMGIVYKAEELSLRRFVALKALGPEIAGDPSAAKRFRREALLVARLNHPNIVKILHLDEHEPPRYFTMELVVGCSLAEKIEKAGFLSPEQGVQMALQACDALEYAHGQSVLHRDIKPNNILLENHIERVRITDFGIARDLSGTAPGPTLTQDLSPGTPPFMSPEQNRGQPLDVRTDIFSLGVTLYYALSGKLPYQASNRVELAEAFLKQQPPPPSRFNSAISEELDRIVLKMAAVNPARRYRSCAALASDLRELAQQDLQPGCWSRFSRDASRAVRKAMMLAGLCLLVILIGWIGVRMVNDLRQPRVNLGAAKPAEPSIMPYAFTVNSPLVTVYDRSGRNVWSVRVNGEVVKAELAPLQPGQANCLIVGVGGEGVDGGKLLVYDAQGNLLWEKQTAEPYRFGGSGVNRMSIRDLLVADLWQDGHLYIVALSHDFEWFPGKVTIYDRNGNAKRVYWHPGHLAHVMAFKPSQGERLRLLAWGCNNDMRTVRPGSDARTLYRALVCLDPETMSGEAPPRRGRIGKGIEEWYALLLPQGLEVERITVRPPSPGSLEGLSGQMLEVRVSGERFLYLDETGKVVNRSGGDTASGIQIPQFELIR